MNNNGLQPIPNKNHEDFFKNIDSSNFLYDDFISTDFYELFIQWIKKSKRNKLTGIDKFNVLKFSSGSVQIFDHFYIKYHKKRFRFFEDEFMYHKAISKHGLNYEFMENEFSFPGWVHSYDAFIISVPFTRKGCIHPKLYNVLDNCEQLNVPVLLDFCHLPVSKNVNIDLNNYSCIETLAFSFSKMLWGAEHLRIGIRLQKKDDDDGIDIFNSVVMINRISVGYSKEIMSNYELDYNWNTYEERYKTYCLENNLTMTDNILYAMNEEERIVIAGSI